MCEHKRKINFQAKSSDLNHFTVIENDEITLQKDGYVPEWSGVGDGDYVEFDYCADCGQILNDVFPLQIEKD